MAQPAVKIHTKGGKLVFIHFSEPTRFCNMPFLNSKPANRMGFRTAQEVVRVRQGMKQEKAVRQAAFGKWPGLVNQRNVWL